MQTRLHSMVEVNNNMVIGFVISWAMWLWVVGPVFGHETTSAGSIAITTMFTVTSMFRQYLLRRFHNWLDHTPEGLLFKARWAKCKGCTLCAALSLIGTITLLEYIG